MPDGPASTPEDEHPPRHYDPAPTYGGMDPSSELEEMTVYDAPVHPEYTAPAPAGSEAGDEIDLKAAHGEDVFEDDQAPLAEDVVALRSHQRRGGDDDRLLYAEVVGADGLRAQLSEALERGDQAAGDEALIGLFAVDWARTREVFGLHEEWPDPPGDDGWSDNGNDDAPSPAGGQAGGGSLRV